jgi:hypothetical protein
VSKQNCPQCGYPYGTGCQLCQPLIACPACDGTGEDGDSGEWWELTECDECKGTGEADE